MSILSIFFSSYRLHDNICRLNQHVWAKHNEKGVWLLPGTTEIKISKNKKKNYIKKMSALLTQLSDTPTG